MKVRVKSVAKALPKYTRKTTEILPFLELWLQDEEPRFRRKIKKIFENAGVDRRYSIMDAEEVFHKSSFEEKNDIYERESIILAENCLSDALEFCKHSKYDLTRALGSENTASDNGAFQFEFNCYLPT